MSFATLAFVLVNGAANAKVSFEVQGRGTFVMEMYEKEAPRTTAHFLNLVDARVYDGMLFHRLVPKFVLQTGDPVSKGWLPEEARAKPGERGSTAGLGDASYGKPVKFEPNKLSHVAGTVGMALESPGDDSGTSHFFINLVDNKRLDGKYVVFGVISEGWDVVQKCRRGDLIVRAKRVR